MTPTPRTDAEWQSITVSAPWDASADQMANHAPQLERELDHFKSSSYIDNDECPIETLSAIYDELDGITDDAANCRNSGTLVSRVKAAVRMARALDFSEQTGKQIWSANERLKAELAEKTESLAFQMQLNREVIDREKRTHAELADWKVLQASTQAQLEKAERDLADAVSVRDSLSKAADKLEKDKEYNARLCASLSTELAAERALADRLAGELNPVAWICGQDSPNSAERALAAWKEARRDP